MDSSQIIPFDNLLKVDEKDLNEELGSKLSKYQRKKLAKKRRESSASKSSNDQLKNEEYKGLNSPLKQKDIKYLIRKNKLVILNVLETKVRENKANAIDETIFRDWKFEFNYEHSLQGKIWVRQDDEKINLRVIEKSK